MYLVVVSSMSPEISAVHIIRLKTIVFRCDVLGPADTRIHPHDLQVAEIKVAVTIRYHQKMNHFPAMIVPAK
jgi:hypothetical protein